MTRPVTHDYLVVGGGFYGCCLALFLRSVCDRVALVEAGDGLMGRASRVNQARVHTGFHYPRSVLTAIKSLALHRRFASDFPQAVVDDFQMLYAVARRRSKVSAKRFHWMFREMGAPIAPASPSQAALFDPGMVEAAFACTEHAFDFSVLRDHLAERLLSLHLDVRLSTRIAALEERADHVAATLPDGSEIRARAVFNVTYSGINALLRTADLPLAPLKHELTEIALVRPPPELRGYGVTVMDGPFFSTMPYPSERLHSLTHVRYTPQASWTDEGPGTVPRPDPGLLPSHHQHMIRDGRRYLPCLSQAEWVRSLFEVKTVLTRNEQDDGRPILFQRRPAHSRVTSILGGKLDNVYDLFDLVRSTDARLVAADDRFVRAGVPPRRSAA